MKKIMLVIVLGLSLMGCSMSNKVQTSALLGTVGGAVGAVLDSNNRWRGGSIGAATGAITGALLYETVNGGRNETVTEVIPTPITECKKVREREWKNGVIIKDEVREICDSRKTDNSY